MSRLCSLCFLIGYLLFWSNVMADGADEQEERSSKFQNNSQEPTEVELTGGSIEQDPTSSTPQTLAKAWYQRFDFSGIAAAGFLQTGKDGARPDGGFLIKQASLHTEVEVWGNTKFFFEIQTNRLGDDMSKYIRTGEVYANFNNLLGNFLQVKVGRFYIPFGEEYLQHGTFNNPLISTSASFPYGWDEGVFFYGNIYGLGWNLAVSDGTDERSVEDNPDKALSVKVYGSPWNFLYLSASFMRNGYAANSAMGLGGSHFQPLGASHPSTLTASPSDKVDALLYELDTRIEVGKIIQTFLKFGQAFQSDPSPDFDRTLFWGTGEIILTLSQRIYAAFRYSEIGTYDSEQGYHFDGKTTAAGNSAFGYDANRFQRLSTGLGWKMNPKSTVRLEFGFDRFHVIEASRLTPKDDQRYLFGCETAVGF